MTENEFMQQQLAAVQRMKEMNARSAFGNQKPHQMPPVPSFVKVPEGKNNRGGAPLGQPAPARKPQDSPPPKAIPPQPGRNRSQSASPMGNGGIPFLDKLLTDSDTTLIIGLLLILMSENADKKLLFALVYILL